MKLFWILLLSGLSLSAISAFFSISGLAILFSGAAIAIAIYASILEIVKLSAVSWIYRRWDVISKKIKAFLILSIFILMVISSLGVFGYLSRAYLEKQNPNKDIEVQLLQIDTKIKNEQESVKRNQLVINQLNAQVDSLVSSSKTERSIVARNRQSKERSVIEADIKVQNKNIDTLITEKNTLQLEQNKTAAELGPLKYVAKIFSPSGDLDFAVRILISFLVVVTDPLAIIILLCASKEKMLREEEDKEQILVDSPEVFQEPNKEDPALMAFPTILEEEIKETPLPILEKELTKEQKQVIIENVPPEIIKQPKESKLVLEHHEQTKHSDYQFQHEIRDV